MYLTLYTLYREKLEEADKLMGILWVHTGAIGCIVLITYYCA